MNVNSILNVDGTFVPAGVDQSAGTTNTYFSIYMDLTLKWGECLELIFL